MTWLDTAILLTTIAVSTLGMLFLHKYLPHDRRVGYNDVGGYVFAAIAAMYSVLLAFVVVAVWANEDNARQSTFHEADSLAGAYWVARELPAPEGPDLERLTLSYAHEVIDVEWKQLARHQSSPAATTLVYRMRQDAFAFNPQTNRDQVLFDHAVSHVEDLASERRARLNQIGDEVPPLLWIALIAGGVMTVGFAFLFGLRDRLMHTMMVSLLAVLVVLSLVVVKEMNYPFDGITRIRPTAFEVFLERLPPPRG